jgi:CRISPR-associated protein Cas1
MLLSFHRHHAQAHIAHLQIAASQPLKKRLWQILVMAKIRNQAALLRQIGASNANVLEAMAGRVGSGDPNNIEAQAAKIYWSALFSGFTRSDDTDRRNALLNYGYAVVRAAIARACVAFGLLPAFGIHHASKTNAFNLVDDLIEPFRPLVDRVAYHRSQAVEGVSLTVDDRRHMAAILNQDTLYAHETMTILAATEAVAASMVRAVEDTTAALLQLPRLS